MHIKRFTVSSERFPRYFYTLGLLRKAERVIQKCALNFVSHMPDFSNIHIFTISVQGLDLFDTKDLTESKCETEVLREEFQCSNSEEIKTQMTGKTCVCISNYEEVLTYTSVPSYFCKNVLLISDPEKEQENLCSDIENMLKKECDVVSIQSRSQLAHEIDFILERLVYKHLYHRIELLGVCCRFNITSFINLFATVNERTEHSLFHKRFNWSLSAYCVAWNETKLEVIKKIMLQLYGQEGKCVTDILFNSKQPYTQPSTNDTPTDELPSTERVHATTSGVPSLEARIKKETDATVASIQKHVTGVCEYKDQIQRCYNKCINFQRNINALEEKRRPKQWKLSESLARKIRDVNGVTGFGMESRVLRIGLDKNLLTEQRRRSEDELRKILASNQVLNFEFYDGQREIVQFADLSAISQNVVEQTHVEDEQISLRRPAHVPSLVTTITRYLQTVRNRHSGCEAVAPRPPLN